MSKINALRLVNLNYNNNAIRISDEVFHMNGESTLLSLRNGGGKSVLVQMMTAPFVHKRYRDAKDRPFESYFTTGKPTFILVEWALDRNSGYVTTGMMVRRRQDMNEETNDNLEIIQFISEYQHPCTQDIYHLPIVEKNKKEIVLKNFGACKYLFDTYKKDPELAFFSYDMNNSAQSKQYFDKLLEYQINYKEWETIMKKVNLKESGLSDLFADCKDEKGLVEKWFLDAVESKLNKEHDRMKEFQNIVEKYVGQYKDNRAKIKRRDIIRQFGEDAVGILETAGVYEQIEEEKCRRQEQIGLYLWQLGQAKLDAEKNGENLNLQQAELQEEVDYLRYQQISKLVYEALDEERYHSANREMAQVERDAKEAEVEETKKQLHLLELARQQAEIDAQERECSSYVQQLSVISQQEQDFGQERRDLGYTLRLYYEQAKKENFSRLVRQNEELEEVRNRILQEQDKLQQCTEIIVSQSKKIAAAETEIAGYDKKEEAYNRRYEPGFTRNLLGEYEPGALEIRRQEYEKEFDALKKETASLRQDLEQSHWKQKEYERNLEDIRKQQMQTKAEQKEEKQVCERFEKELAERKTILRYFGLDQPDLYDKDKILSAAGRKLTEIDSFRRSLEKEEDELQKEYVRMTQGKVLELPEEFEHLLEDLGISYIYGMEWLKNNQHTPAENRTLVQKHPFLPYALLMSRQDIQTLKEQKEAAFTSFPIPLMVREQLEGEENEKKKAVVDYEDVSFYVLFNQHLLNERKLKQLAAGKQEQIARKKEQIRRRQEEYESYLEKREIIRKQRVTKTLEEQAAQSVGKLEEKIQKQEAEIEEKRQQLEQMAAHLQEIQKQIQDNLLEQNQRERRMEDLKELAESYDAYRKQREQAQQLKKELEQTKDREQLAKSTGEKLSEREKKLQIETERLSRLGEELSQKAAAYEQYEAAAQVSGQIEDLENRYQAITGRLSLHQQEIEHLLQAAREKQQKMQRELERHRKKYRVAREAWKQIAYNENEEEYTEKLLAQHEQQLELKRAQWNEADKNTALASQQVAQRKQQLMEKCRQAAPLPKAEIQPMEYESEMEQRLYHIRELEKEKAHWQKWVSRLEENLTALAEYAEFMPENEDAFLELEEKNGILLQDLEGMSGEELRKKKGMLVRDYNQCLERRQRQKDILTGQLNAMVRKEIFAEDFYRKPIEAMLTLTDDAAQVIHQLQTTLLSYENLIEKIQVDISVVEKEKARIIELLGEYVQDVHKNLGRIDQNSTIPIRGKAVKMLKLTLPDWEENSSLYQIRLQDFVDETTQRGIQLLEQNYNVQEYFGTRLTTKSLYDDVVGVENVQIRLYKIEEQREYPITWSQVAKNSGGEGFLSAFIILSSLLYYMRREESDIFAEQNEGKVLLMDNPFAQTNASHLLIPLMDMAKKTNTQLICLSGLGGESIYSRFDNIYVLNLIAASLRNGTQYVKAEHMRGAEPEVMEISQIEVLEQPLIF